MGKLDNEQLVFDWNTETYSQPGARTIPSLCNSVLVTNIGTVLVMVDGYPLNPAPAPGANGETWVLGGNKGEIIQRKTIDISFAAGGRVVIQFKWYIKNQ